MNTPTDHFDNSFGDDASGQIPPSDEVRAGEYVLGVLDREERTQVQARIAAEPAFARLVEAWEAKLSPWLLQAQPLEPSAHVWPRLRTQLGWASVERAPKGVWNNVGFWRGATALAIAAGIAAVVVGVRTPPSLTPPPPVVVVQPPPVEEPTAKPVAVLARDDGSTGWLASIDAFNGKLLMVPVPTPADVSGLVHELWLIPAGKAPLSLGFVSNEKAHTIVVPDALRGELAVGATLAITLEPKLGMPHAAPSGPIVVKGGIQQI